MRFTTDAQYTGIPARITPELESPGQGESRLNISVLFTTEEATIQALRTAHSLAQRLHGRITLLVTEVVSYQLPLNEPPVPRAWHEEQLRKVAERSGVDTTIRFYICRDREETLVRNLKPGSPVVLGGRRRWWPTAESRLARRLRRLGHEVILTETE